MPLSDEAMADLIGEAIATHTAPLREKIADLEKRLVDVETKGIEYSGVFQRGLSYKRNALVSSNGLWISLRNIQPGEAPPGTADSPWLLIVKGPYRGDKGVIA